MLDALVLQNENLPNVGELKSKSDLLMHPVLCTDHRRFKSRHEHLDHIGIDWDTKAAVLDWWYG